MIAPGRGPVKKEGSGNMSGKMVIVVGGVVDITEAELKAIKAVEE